MIRIERDPEFWTSIAAHPALTSALLGLSPDKVGALARRPEMLPIAAEHGGFLFARLDTLGFVCELHTLFTPQGWGREALLAGVEAMSVIWALGYQTIVTFESRINTRSRPPRTFGFRQAGDWRSTLIGELRMWTVTQSAWNVSSARRLQCPH